MRILSLFVLFAFAFISLSAQTDSTNTSPAKTSSIPLDTSGMAKVYVIRSTGHLGSAINLRMVVNDIMMCKVKNNHYAVVFVKPGTHMFNATTWDKPGTPQKFALKMPVEAGKTYYMTMHMKQKFMGVEIFLEEVTYNTASPLIAKYKQDECD
ncbi:DUF2846 domain-containing protein [Segetibacter aerophilus]|uniref:DUF2846 domain-containing protein n=1 Tax=Segetibacter aerophilus TaxID=670293 RepID=A0A512B9R3_9BACT|nr:DUF2846 domain-containing protein [Segetibacter aerophilus]GEO08691.1 hypothetical protein SAE01_11870 [Segetibacter aerophilus]